MNNELFSSQQAKIDEISGIFCDQSNKGAVKKGEKEQTPALYLPDLTLD